MIYMEWKKALWHTQAHKKNYLRLFWPLQLLNYLLFNFPSLEICPITAKNVTYHIWILYYRSGAPTFLKVFKRCWEMHRSTCTLHSCMVCLLLYNNKKQIHFNMQTFIYINLCAFQFFATYPESTWCWCYIYVCN